MQHSVSKQASSGYEKLHSVKKSSNLVQYLISIHSSLGKNEGLSQHIRQNHISSIKLRSTQGIRQFNSFCLRVSTMQQNELGDKGTACVRMYAKKLPLLF